MIACCKCISKLARSQLGVHLWVHSITASRCMSKLARPRPRSVSLSSVDLGLQVHLSTGSITVSKYIVHEQRQVYGDTGVTEVDWATGSTYSRDPGVDRHHLIFISSGSTQLRGFSRPGSIMSSHFLPRLLELEPFFLTNSVRMTREVWRNVDGGLTDVQLRRITTTASKWCIFQCSQLASPGAPPIMLDYHLWPAWPYVYI